MMRLLSEAEVSQLIGPELAIAAAEKAYLLQANANSGSPFRHTFNREEPRFRGLVVGGILGNGTFGVKTNLHSYANGGQQPHSASMLLVWDTSSCNPTGLIASAAFNDHRTAAGFAVAARTLSAPTANTLALFGAGKIAAPTALYLARVRPLKRIILVSRTLDRTRDLAATLRKQLPDITIELGASPEGAAHSADIIATVTTSDSPVFPGKSVRPGTLVILGGANRPHAREADDEFARRALIYVDNTTGCLEEAGDLKIPLASGVLNRERIVGEIGTVISHQPPFQAPDDAVIGFKSIGLSSQDLVLAEMLLAAARAADVGVLYDPILGTMLMEEVNDLDSQNLQ